jgi:hypothetical protein
MAKNGRPSEALRPADDHLEPAVQRIGHDPSLTRCPGVSSAGHYSSLNALAPVARDGFRVEYCNGHKILKHPAANAVLLA